MFDQALSVWTKWIESLPDDVLFIKDRRNWTKPYPESLAVARFMHIISVTPFKTFWTKIKRWKKLNG